METLTHFLQLLVGDPLSVIDSASKEDISELGVVYTMLDSTVDVFISDVSRVGELGPLMTFLERCVPYDAMEAGGHTRTLESTNSAFGARPLDAMCVFTCAMTRLLLTVLP